MNPTHTHPDARLDRVLDALRSAQPDPGFEARIAAHLAAHADARRTAPNVAPTSFFAVIVNILKAPRMSFADSIPFALAATALTLVLTLSLVHYHHNPQTVAQWNHTHTAAPTQTATTEHTAPGLITTTRFQRAGLQPRHESVEDKGALTPVGATPDIPEQTDGQATDLEAIALAETQAPSHPAPPMPLTSQEALLVRATRPGQPIELAEVSVMRENSLRTLADVREHANLRQYIQGLLAPLAAAQAFEPTSSSSPDAVAPAAASDLASPPQSK